MSDFVHIPALSPEQRAAFDKAWLAAEERTTPHDLALDMAAAIVPAQRQDGSNYWKLADGSPEWMRDLVQHAHAGQLPNDWRYEAIMRAVRFFAEDAIHLDADTSAVAEIAEEHIDSLVSAGTVELAEWLASHPARAAYVDEAASLYGLGDQAGIWDRLRHGQRVELEEVFGLVQRGLLRQYRRSGAAALPCVG